ncbi:MAG: DUF3800 domain-containing protein [Gemmatimonadota bacterium]|nr:MAG: DUF3800 domain-containing protein [Gemmatimonadota bacterium]
MCDRLKSTYELSLQRKTEVFRSVGNQWGVVRNLSDVPMFVDSQACRCVQLADHIAYATFRYYEHGDSDLFKIICSEFDRGEDGVVHGLVHLHKTGARCNARDFRHGAASF